MKTIGPQIVDGRAALDKALGRLRSFAPSLSRTRVSVLLPRPNQTGAQEAYISAHQKRRAFESVGFSYHEIIALTPECEREVVGAGEMFVVQRPASRQLLSKAISTEAIDLDLQPSREGGRPLSATAEAALRLARQFCSSGKRVGIVGARGAVGSQILQAVRELTPDVEAIDLGNSLRLLRSCDVIISAVGRPALVQPQHLSEKVDLLVDIGFSYDAKNDLIRGDIAESSHRKSRYYTPVPGGIGPLSILTLLERALDRTLSVPYAAWRMDLV